MKKMFSDLLKQLHMYIGIDVDDQDFLVYLLPLIMSEPENEKECEEEEQGKYYPYSGEGTDIQNAYLVYSGNRVMPKTRAKKVKGKFNPLKLKEEILNLGKESKEEFAVWLTSVGKPCSFVNIGEAVCDYLKEMIWKMAGADAELVMMVFQIPAIASASEYNKNFGSYLASEARNNCLYPNCTNKLYIRENGHIKNNYDVVIIDESQNNEDPDNMLALCPTCAMKYRYSLTPDIWNELIDLKLKVQSEADAYDILSEDKVVAGLQRIIDMIPLIPLDGLDDLSFDPKTIREKMDGTDFSLTRKIIGQARDYYSILNERFTITTKINEKLEELNKIVDDSKNPIYFVIRKSDSYELTDGYDEGMGHGFVAMVMFDLAILSCTQVPVLAHDTLIFNNMGTEPIERILRLYNQSKKQIFISYDKQDVFTPEAGKILEDSTVLKLSRGGNELYGGPWEDRED